MLIVEGSILDTMLKEDFEIKKKKVTKLMENMRNKFNERIQEKMRE